MDRNLDQFDIVIAGGGLAGLMHADHLADDPSPELRVAIIDPDPDSLLSKTFASWQLKASPRHRYADCVENQWDRFRITPFSGPAIVRDFGDYRYERIPGELLHQKIKKRLARDPRFVWIRDAVVDVSDKLGAGDLPEWATVTLVSGRVLKARRVLSSIVAYRPQVLQYFLGFELEAESDQFDPGVVDLMDFRVDQEGEVRFVYVLPFDRRRALVEFTVFSPNRLPDADCEVILRRYIDERLGLTRFTIHKVESGAIPMTLEAVPRFPASHPGSLIQVIGGAAGMVKPSTGYSFQRNLSSIAEGPKTSYGYFRFQVYDALLLRIIRNDGGIIWRIFQSLFSANGPTKVFGFLDEKSRFSDEIRIFFSLPWSPFLRGLVALYPFLFAVAISATFYWTIGGVWVWVIPVLGLVTTGIGHGSVDHLLEPPTGKSWVFYGRYLGVMLAFLLIWFFYPPLAIGFFLWQSADHFGEANWIRAIRNADNAFWSRALAWIWGLFAALFGVLFHWQEATPILQLILRDTIAIQDVSPDLARLMGVLLFAAAIVSAGIFDRYERKALGRSVMGLPATVVLGCSMMLLPLLPGFLCFFAFWHAWDTIAEQKTLNRWTTKEYASKALRYTLTSVAGLFLLIATYSAWDDYNRLWQILFVMIGALTAAHAPVMKRFLKRKPPRLLGGAAR